MALERLGPKLPPRWQNAVKEAPAGSNRWYFVDKKICESLQITAAPLLQKDGAQVVNPEQCVALLKALRDEMALPRAGAR